MPLPFSPTRTVALIGIAALGALAIELGLRAADFDYPKPSMRGVVWNHAEDAVLRSDTGLNQIDERQLWKPRPGARIPWCPDETVNAQGFRGPELSLERDPDLVRIAILGSSATFGYGREWKDTYAARLVDELAAYGVRAEVLCGGVLNSTVCQGLERYRDLVRPYKPDILLCAYWGNAEYQQAWHSFTDQARIRHGCGMLLKPQEKGAWITLRTHLKLLHLGAWMANVFNGLYWDEALVDMQERRNDRTIGAVNSPVMRRVPLGDFRECLVQLTHEVRADGVSLIFINISRSPSLRLESPMLDRYQAVVEDIAREEGIAVLRDLDVVRQNPVPGATTDTLIPDQRHEGENPHLLLAQALAAELQKLPGMRR